VRALLDTQLLIWASLWEPDGGSPLSAATAALIEDRANQLVFSVASIWEITIKSARGRADFTVDSARLRRELIDNDYLELPISGAHALAVASLPPIHKDPFDRLLVAQARVEGITLLTADDTLASYGSSVRRV
jgi:PIN domain nuclease of toxin-antitoxin system